MGGLGAAPSSNRILSPSGLLVRTEGSGTQKAAEVLLPSRLHGAELMGSREIGKGL